MKVLKNKLISRKLIYALTLIIATAGIMFITIKMYSKVQLQTKLPESSTINITTLKVAKIDEAKETTLKVTSRGSYETRNDSNDVNEEKIKESENKEDEKNEDTSTSSKKSTTTTNKTTKASTTNNNASTSKTTATSQTTSTSKSTASISKVKISKDMDLTVRTGLSREDFIKLMAGVKQDTSGFFEENAGKIYDLCEQYSINEVFFCGLISAESGWNIASNHRKTHNYISLMKNGKLISYSSVDEGLEVAAKKLHDNYLTKGGKFYHGKTLSGVKTNFCPASSTWVDLVYGRMKQIVK